MSPFNHPAKFAETAAMFGAALRNDRLDAAFAQSLTMRVGIVAPISIDDLGLLKRPAACTADRRNRVDERQQLGDVVAWPATLASRSSPKVPRRRNT